jgi:3-hydroxybutyryl-CoA dehydratase
MKQRYFDDFQVGEVFHTPSRTLTDAHFLFFAGLTGDNHPIHYDDEYARQTPFGRRLAHGLLLTSLTALGAGELSAQVEESMIAFLSQSASFRAPVFIGDTIRPELEVAELIPKGERGVLKLRSRLRNQRDEVVLEGEHVYLVHRRPGSGGEA